MSQENVEAVRDRYAATNERDSEPGRLPNIVRALRRLRGPGTRLKDPLALVRDEQVLV